MEITPPTRQPNQLVRDRLKLIGEITILLAIPSLVPIATAGLAKSLSLVIIVIVFWGLIVGGINRKTQRKIDKSRQKAFEIKVVKKFYDKVWSYADRFMSPRLAWLFRLRAFHVLTALLIILCCISLWSVVPLADTIPSVALMLFGFSLAFRDFYVWLAALVTGALGVLINLGSVIFVVDKIIEFITGRWF